jgi:putative heme iron utilization protein
MDSEKSSAAQAKREEVPENQRTPACDARILVRRGRKASLGTLDKDSGHPHVSLVTVATEPDGSPLLLLSKLAVHTQNILADARCTLLFDGTDAKGDPLAGGRVTLTGRVKVTDSVTARARFLARHPEAVGYASFADFSFFQLDVERAHFIGGFGRIVPLKASDLLIDVSAAGALIEGEPGIVSHMNEDHADANQLYATALAGVPAADWQMTGIDPDGLDLVEAGGGAVRILFSEPISSPADARRELVRLVSEARAVGQAAE